MTVFARSATMALGLAASFPIAGEPVGQRSAQQLVVDAGVIVRQMEDAKRLAPCIRDSDRGGLLTNAERWIAAARASPHKDDRQVLERVSALRSLTREMVAKPSCSLSPAGRIDAQRSPPDTSPGPATQLGKHAGEFANESPEGLFLGDSAGREATTSSYSTIAGHAAGYRVKASPNVVLLGRSAGESLAGAPSAVAVGSSAGRHAKTADHTVFIGGSAGYAADTVDHSIFLGYAAGRSIRDNKQSVIAGYAAGERAHRAHQSVMAGPLAGYAANDSPRSVMIGQDAGLYAEQAPAAIMIGPAAGQSARNATNPVFIGANAGKAAANTADVVLIGTSADAEPGITNAVGIGRGANPARSNTWHIPEALKLGVGTSAPTAQLHTTRNVRFAALANGVLVTDRAGNVSASSLLNEALKEIARLKVRVEALEAAQCRQ